MFSIPWIAATKTKPFVHVLFRNISCYNLVILTLGSNNYVYISCLDWYLSLPSYHFSFIKPVQVLCCSCSQNYCACLSAYPDKHPDVTRESLIFLILSCKCNYISLLNHSFSFASRHFAYVWATAVISNQHILRSCIFLLASILNTSWLANYIQNIYVWTGTFFIPLQ